MPNSDLKIEALAPDSLSEFIKLTKLYFKELDIIPEFYALDQDVTHPLNTYAPPRGGFWLARTEKYPQPIGMVGVLPLAKKTCELRRLFLIPEYRQKKWGEALVQHAVDFARKAEYFEVLVSLYHNQKAALTLFEHHGFKPCARYSEHQHAGIFLSLKLNA